MGVVTRFAPAPTGFLHIGGAHTALFNYLFARHHEGKFLLRIEDTDPKRSTRAFVDSITSDLRWLNLDWDGEIVFQSSRIKRYQKIAERLISSRQAYYCSHTSEELKILRKKADQKSYLAKDEESLCGCDKKLLNKTTHGLAIRLRVNLEGMTTFEDKICGPITVLNKQLDDMVLLRSDKTPTYTLSVVVDDHDMRISHILRGNDHLTNTFRQLQIYKALKWKAPIFAHIPLIHGKDGGKLSKRQGSWSIENFRADGLLPAAICNYMLRLGWSHGNDEIIPRSQAIKLFTTSSIGRSPARFDIDKLYSINAYYLRRMDSKDLVRILESRLPHQLDKHKHHNLLSGMEGLKTRVKTLVDLANQACIYTDDRPIPLQKKARSFLEAFGKEVLLLTLATLDTLSPWTSVDLERAISNLALVNGNRLDYYTQPLRAAVTGQENSPNIFEIMSILGKQESLDRIKEALARIEN